MKARRFINQLKLIFRIPVLERLLSVFTRNKDPENFFARLPPLYTTYPKNSFRKVSRGGIRYELDISDYMEWLAFYGIQVEPRKSLYSLLKEGDCVLDVGANIGEVTLNMARIVGPSGSIHSFEPDSVVYSKILKNVNLNVFANIHLNNFALGSKEDELFLDAQVESNRGGTRIQPSGKQGKKVAVSTIDVYVSQKALGVVSLIKIDVEGYELHVLQGAATVLSRDKPILFVEVNDNNLKDQGHSAKSLIAFLEKCGYQSVRHANTGEPIYSDLDFTQCHFDVIAQ